MHISSDTSFHRPVTPAPLRPGDTIAIISPATIVNEEYIAGAAAMLTREGYRVRIMSGANGPSSGSYASSLDVRIADLREALADPEVKCIFCARGGYGCVHLLPLIDPQEIRLNPKWIVGFSDISALHALWLRSGVKSLHSPMAKHLSLLPREDIATSAMLEILGGSRGMDYRVTPHMLNRSGKSTGRLQGGNLAVLNGLAATPYDILDINSGEDVVLFIEDISEAIYAVERMLYRLYLAGVFNRIKGLIIGQFTEYHPDRNFTTMEEMIDAFLKRHNISGFPVAFNFPVGHVDFNLPMIEGDYVEFNVSNDSVTLRSLSSIQL